jgi:cytochrome P450
MSAALTGEPTLLPPELSADVLAERARAYPIGASLTHEVLEDGSDSAIWHRLREREPVTWCPVVEGWLVTRRAWGAEIYRAPERFTVFTAFNIVRRVLGEQMLSSDGERHDRQRRPFEPPFKARPVREHYRELVRRRADEEIAAAAEDEVLDLGVWASRFAVATIAEVLGLGEKRPEELRQMYDAFASAMDYGVPDQAERMAAAHAARRRFEALLLVDLERVSREPDGSILSHVAQQEAGGGLTAHEIIQNVRLILFGAIETVESMVVNTWWLLLRNPEALAAVRADRGLAANAIEEALRLIPPVGFSDRYATTDLAWHGAELRAGEMILPVAFAMNRDPETFADPDAFDIRRDNARAHYSLAHGKHFCLGANLARLQGEAVVNAFLDAFSTLELDATTGAPAGFTFRRVAPVRLRCG